MRFDFLIGLVGLPALVGSFAVGLVMIIGARKMMRLESYRWGMAASILALLPCSPVSLLGLAMGIWSLVVLNRRNVMAAFDAQKTSRRVPTPSQPPAGAKVLADETLGRTSEGAPEPRHAHPKKSNAMSWVAILLVVVILSSCLLSPIILVLYWTLATPMVSKPDFHDSLTQVDSTSGRGQDTQPLTSSPPRATGWMMGSGGPVLTDVFAHVVLKLQPPQIEEVNEILQASYREFLAIEQQNIAQHTDDAGHTVVTIKPFPASIAKLEDGLWSQLDKTLDSRQQSVARLNVLLDPLPVQAPMSLSEIVAPGFFGWGKEGARIEIWRVGTWYHWRVQTRGYEDSSRAPQLPEEYRRFWKDASPQAEPELVRLERVGHLPDGGDDPFLSLAVQGKYAYLIQGNVEKPKRLHVVDLSEPSRPRVVGSCPVTVEAGKLAVSGNDVYVLDGPNLRVFDVSDPAAPRDVGLCELGKSLWDVAVQGRYAYVTDVESLRVIDLQNPTTPKQIGRCDVADAQGVAVVGQHAYIACDIEGLSIVDISNPNSPAQVGRFNGPAGAAAVAVVGKYAFIAGGEDAVTLWIADISDPKQPRSVGKYGDWIVGSVAIHDDLAYIAGGDLDILDISNPAAPKRVGSHTDVGFVSIAGDDVFVLGDEGFSILRVARNAN